MRQCPLKIGVTEGGDLDLLKLVKQVKKVTKSLAVLSSHCNHLLASRVACPDCIQHIFHSALREACVLHARFPGGRVTYEGPKAIARGANVSCDVI